MENEPKKRGGDAVDHEQDAHGTKDHEQDAHATVDASHDRDEIRCRRLGHEVPFHFCRTEGSGDEPCRLLADCWWERFDIQEYIRANYPHDKAEDLQTPKPPPNKVLSLFEMIQEAKERLEK